MTARAPAHEKTYAALQCAQMPEISITGVLGVKPAVREAVLMVAATAALAASPTAPHCSQMRNTTGSPLRVIVHAGDEGVAAFDAVHEALLAQEVERAVDGDRRRPAARSASRSISS